MESNYAKMLTQRSLADMYFQGQTLMTYIGYIDIGYFFMLAPDLES